MIPLTPLTSVKFVPYEMKTSLIKVYSYIDKNIAGTFHNNFYQEEKQFDNLTILLLLIENLQDAISYPQKSMDWRTFNKDSQTPAIDNSTITAYSNKKPQATFKINIVFRQNASWQGSVCWMEKGMETEFRSALELIFLMDNVLTDSI
jgi:hypothetical protein